MKRLTAVLLILLGLLFLTACEQQAPPPVEEKAPAAEVAETPPAETEPPRPPIMEDFEGEPQLSLFPRVGDYRPPREDENFPYWVTFIDHLTKVSGRARGGTEEKPNHAWSFRGIKSIDSVGYFSPVAVKPGTTYRVSAKIMTDLPKGGKAGIGIIEFKEFSWEGEQYEKEMVDRLIVGSQIGVQLEGETGLDIEQNLTFTPSPETQMIHLVLFREGEHNRKPLIFDDISIVTWVEDTGEVEKIDKKP